MFTKEDLTQIEQRGSSVQTVEQQVEGIVEGSIATQEAGCGGFGYDPLFIPDGHDCTFAEMSADEKNAISHRGRAIQKLVAFLKK